MDCCLPCISTAIWGLLEVPWHTFWLTRPQCSLPPPLTFPGLISYGSQVSWQNVWRAATDQLPLELSAGEKALGLSCCLRFLEDRYTKELSWPMVTPFSKSRGTSNTVPTGPLHYTISGYATKSLGLGDQFGSRFHFAIYWSWDPGQIT